MITIKSFEDEIASLKKTYKYGSYEYSDPSKNFTEVTASHFKKVRQQKKYGVYVVHQCKTREVLYIGKSGTIESRGKFKGQEIPGRLTNVKGKICPNEWFRDLLRKKGPLVIEYIFLPTSISPALIESVLLQAYLNEHHRLPYRNKSF